MDAIFKTPLFGIAITIFAFQIGVYLNKKTKSALVNPLLVAITIIIFVLNACKIPYASYKNGGDIITMLVAPATAVLGYSIYRQISILKKYFLPILAGCFIGSLTSITSVYFLCRVFHLDQALSSSLLPKSVTTAIAIEVSEQLGGIPAITVAIVVVTGVLGGVFGPLLIKLFHIDHEVAQGVAMGTASHAVGTSKAIELGEVQGAMSGIAIGVAGLMTVLISLFL